jgi:hypothetical protein
MKKTYNNIKRDEFKKQVEYVMKGNPKSHPEIESEQIVEQRKAKKLLEDL